MEHNLSSYRNHKCRCPICTKANRDYCRIPRRGIQHGICNFFPCKETTLYANGLCYRHYTLMAHLIERGIRTHEELVIGGYLNP